MRGWKVQEVEKGETATGRGRGAEERGGEGGGTKGVLIKSKAAPWPSLPVKVCIL